VNEFLRLLAHVGGAVLVWGAFYGVLVAARPRRYR
jgi:hypothetical protein